jgi:Sulfatase
MGYQTPNIDRVAKEGAMFTDWYGQQSCTAGRAAFITGQSPIRTGLTKVGLPGADLGLRSEDPHSSSLWVTSPASSARTTSVTAMSSCPPLTASMSSSGTFTTLTRSRSLSARTTRKIPSSRRSSDRAGSCTPGPTPMGRRRLKTPVHSPSNAWKPWTRSFSMPA